MSESHPGPGWLLALASLALSGCGLAREYCDALCDCELCNDRKYDECVIDRDMEIDVAATYDCGDEHEDYLRCQMDRRSCEDERWRLERDDCASEGRRYDECIEKSSSIVAQVPCHCLCNCENGMTAATCTGNGCCQGACLSACVQEGYGNLVSVEAEQCSQD